MTTGKSLYELVTSKDTVENISTLADQVDDIDARGGGRDQTPLMAAAQLDAEYQYIAAILIDKGADIHAKDREGNTPLHFAAHHNQTDTVDALLRSGADPNARSRTGATPLHEAVWGLGASGFPSIESLLSAGADIHAACNNNQRALDYAMNSGSYETLRFLLKKGADPNKEGKYGMRPIKHAINQESQRVLDILICGGADIHFNDKQGRSLLYYALENYLFEEDILRLLIKHGIDIHRTDRLGNTALHHVFAGMPKKYNAELRDATQAECVEVLLECGAEPGRTNNQGCTTRLLAAVFGRASGFTAMAEWEKTNGLNDNLGGAILTAEQTITAIKNEGQEPHLGSIAALLAGGASADTLLPALLYLYDRAVSPSPANSNERSSILRILLEAGLDPCAVIADNGATLLRTLCRVAPASDINILLKAGGEEVVNLRDDAGNTPLHDYLEKHANPSVSGLQHLLDAGADETMTNGRGQDITQILQARTDADKLLDTFSERLQDYGYQTQSPSSRADAGTHADIIQGR